MADVEATLFPSQRVMLEDSPNGDDGLPNTTNAQESMHRVYYMFSAGKKHLFYSMVKLYRFVMALERDYHMVMRGIPIKYGNRPRKHIDISESIGWKKPTKRQQAFINDGRAPDTTDELVSERLDKRAKGGRPPKAPNINRGLHTTFVSYAAPKETHKQFDYLNNRCWLVATLESLFAVYSPLWLQQPGGKSKELFFNVVSHFSTRSTFDLTPKGSICSTLTNGSKSIFDLVNQINPASFVPGKFSSADQFMEMCINTSSNSSKVLPSLFQVHKAHKFLCPTHPDVDQKQHPRAKRTLDVLKIVGIQTTLIRGVPPVSQSDGSTHKKSCTLVTSSYASNHLAQNPDDHQLSSLSSELVEVQPKPDHQRSQLLTILFPTSLINRISSAIINKDNL
ncbi:hypothetical protein PTTG_29711 [Puccinia triticina 1-1 BBBD Race 1]|uniref:Uncharacterized protein n=1 Tax=Puccinia triticina (isolate 1-1 / race 1 (BBBD)) TaxID=630390 RepID=A0A180G326_PUCT1|nr:hypothetical protein PTTG_29711 [Puccinia triticina 1-1 BBBD Race 1]